MIIGILLTSFNNIGHIENCLSAWVKQREENKEHKFIISANSGMFKENFELIGENTNEYKKWLDGTIDYLQLLKINNKIDYLYTYEPKEKLYEWESRSKALNYLLENNIELLMILDGDEIYKEEQINKIIKFVEKKNEYDYYKINFKNYIGKNKYILDFNPSRIFWNKIEKHGGIKCFSYDNDILFNDGTDSRNTLSIDIPKNYVCIEHHSWDGDKEAMIKKIEYQKKHFNGVCSYSWDNNLNELIFDEEFHKRYNISLPFVYEEK